MGVAREWRGARVTCAGDLALHGVLDEGEEGIDGLIRSHEGHVVGALRFGLLEETLYEVGLLVESIHHNLELCRAG